MSAELKSGVLQHLAYKRIKGLLSEEQFNKQVADVIHYLELRLLAMEELFTAKCKTEAAPDKKPKPAAKRKKAAVPRVQQEASGSTPSEE